MGQLYGNVGHISLLTYFASHSRLWERLQGMQIEVKQGSMHARLPKMERSPLVRTDENEKTKLSFKFNSETQFNSIDIEQSCFGLPNLLETLQFRQVLLSVCLSVYSQCDKVFQRQNFNIFYLAYLVKLKIPGQFTPYSD